MKSLAFLALAAALAAAAAAPERRNVLETLSVALAGDRAYDAPERARLLAAIRTRFADYGFQVVTAERAPAIPVALSVITEGSFDQAPPDRIADVAFAAYQAVERGAPPEEVQGIALYGYRKKISGDVIAAWANGYRQAVGAKVPPAVAADLVDFAMNRDLPVTDFDALKWALVNGVKDGFDAKDYATFLLGTMAGGKLGPGAISMRAVQEFRRARAEGRKPRLPAYAATFNPAPLPAPVYTAPVAPASEEPAPSPAPRPSSRPAAAARIPRAAAASPKMAALWPGLDATSRSYLGTPYVWGGTSHSGIDCSGLTSDTYDENLVRIPRVSRDQFRIGSSVAGTGLRDGDLVFFNTLGVGVSHVGMVIDAKKRLFIQSSSSKGVTISPLDNKYYAARYLGARRVVP